MSTTLIILEFYFSFQYNPAMSAEMWKFVYGIYFWLLLARSWSKQKLKQSDFYDFRNLALAFRKSLYRKIE